MLRRVFVVLVVVSGVVGVAVSPALGAGDANMASCGNEAFAGFQSYLPDCRAYEMVSPSFKSGAHPVIMAVSGDGSRLLMESTGAFGGVESDRFGAVYLLSRSAAGWAAAGIGPPASLFPSSQFFAASGDLGRTLWGVRGPAQSILAKDLYVREADGSLVKVGPMTPPSAEAGPPAEGYQLPSSQPQYAGASSDLTHVVFTLSSAFGNVLWPGDSTATNLASLYEYVGIGNRRPELVGVSDGSTVRNGETLAAGRLISDCSTKLGSYDGDDAYNAVSANGERVFFTAVGHDVCASGIGAPEVSELYARLAGSETVAVSEPLSAQCEACSTSVRMPAGFRGASRDGSKVFFMTEQELLPGAATMNLYEYDFNNPAGGKIVRVSVGSAAPEVQGVARVSQDGSHVYFVAKGVLTQGANGAGSEPVGGGENLYVFERDAAHAGGRVTFVATLSEEDNRDWGPVDIRPVQATPDGRFLVFASVGDLTPGDASAESQIFEYDALSEELVRVSIGQAGYPGGMTSADAHPSHLPEQFYVSESPPSAANTRLAVSADGSRVVFGSVGALTEGAQAAAAADAESVYEYRSAGSIANGNVYPISDGRDAVSKEQRMLDASGGDVFFTTAEPLSARDGDSQFDIYDARIDGGFPAAVAPAGCAGEACQGSPSALPAFAVAGSASAPGGESVPSSQPAPPGTPKVKARTRARKLARALRACKRRRGRGRAVCEARARKRYRAGSALNAKGKG